MDTGELYPGKVELYIDFRDFGTAGNLMSVTLKFTGRNGSIKMKCELEDVLFAHGNSEMYEMYIVMDKLKDSIFAYSKPNDGSGTLVMVQNVAVFEKDY